MPFLELPGHAWVLE